MFFGVLFVSMFPACSRCAPRLIVVTPSVLSLCHPRSGDPWVHPLTSTAVWGSPFSAPGGEPPFRTLSFDSPLGRRRSSLRSLAPPLFSIVCGFRLSPASAFLLLAPAVSSAGAQFLPAFSPSLLFSRLPFCFVFSLSLLPEAGAVRRGQRANLLTCCAQCTVPVGCDVSSTGAFVWGVLPALSCSPFPFGVVCFCRCRDLCFVMCIAVARDLACSVFLWRLSCRCMFVMRFVSHDLLIKSGDSWLRASTRQSCDMPACIEARYSVPRGELVHSGCDV